MTHTKTLAVNTLLLFVGLIVLYQFTGNPFKNVLLELFSDEIKGSLVEATYYDDYDERGNLDIWYVYTYNYKIGDRLYEKTVNEPISEMYFEASIAKPIPMEVEYVYFFPSISQLKPTEGVYGKSVFHIIKSLVITLGMYLAMFVFYFKETKESIISVLNESYSSPNTTVIETNFNWGKQLFSLVIDTVLFLIAFGLVILLYQLIESKGLSILLMYMAFVVLHYVTQKMKEDSVATVLYISTVILAFIFPICSSVDLYGVYDLNQSIIRALITTLQITFLKFITEIILTKSGFEIEYPIIRIIRGKVLRNRV